MTTTQRSFLWLFAIVVLLLPVVVPAQEFTYWPPGDLIPGSGTGRVDHTVYLEDMRFPIELAPAYANSQVWGVGGSRNPGGSECDAVNYSYPWRDNFCETRNFPTSQCPTGKGHQGQDIRASTCVDRIYWAVATESGRVSKITRYNYRVELQGDSGFRHAYLHMHEGSLVVKFGDRVKAGDRIGLISDTDKKGGSATFYHLHYELISGGTIYPPYMSLVNAYKKLIPQCTPAAVPGAENEVFKDMPPGSFAYNEAKILYAHGITNGCKSEPRLFCPNCPVKRSHMAAFIVRSAGWPLVDTTPSFTDVPTDHTFYREIETLKAHGVTHGCGNGKYCPDSNVTRGQMAAFLRRAAGWPTVTPETPSFNDVPRDHLFYGDIETIYAHRVTYGCGNGNYCPEADLTRAQAAIFLVRTFSLQ